MHPTKIASEKNHEKQRQKERGVYRPSRMGEQVEGETFVLSKREKTRLERKGC